MKRLPIPAALLLIAAMSLATSAVADPPGGTPICRDNGTQSSPAALSDGAGGVLVAWLDERRGVSDLYAHHVLAGGGLDPSWPANGAVVSESGTAAAPSLFADGAGGALVVWFDASAGALMAQRIRGDGTRDPAWPANGRVLVAAPIGGPSGGIVRTAGDGSGGLYVLWNTFDFTTEPILLQRFGPDGSAQWASPRTVANAGLGGSRFTGVFLGASSLGAVVAWSTYEDLGIGFSAPCRATQTNPDGSAGYHTDLAGPYGGGPSVSATALGIAVDAGGSAFVRFRVAGLTRFQRLSAAGAFEWPTDRTIATDGELIPDDAGGVFGVGTSGVVVDRRASNGSVPSGWSGSGLVISSAATFGPVATAVIPGGLLLCWADDVGGRGADIRAIAVTHAGAPAAGWDAGGNLVQRVRGDQVTPALAADAAGNGIAAWRDLRRAGGDIYGGPVTAWGGGGRGMIGTGGGAPAAAEEGRAEPLAGAGPALRVDDRAAAGPGWRVAFSLPEDGEAALDLLDVMGRRLRGQVVLGARGRETGAWLSPGDLPRGIYWIRIRQGGWQAAARVAHVN